MKRNCRLGVGGLVTIAAMALSASPAIAGTWTTWSTYVNGVEHCWIQVPQYATPGEKICYTGWDAVEFSDGRAHTYVIGMNHAIWNIISYAGGGASGWRSLGGWGQQKVEIRWANSPSVISIWTYGADGDPWCKNFNSAWTNWFRCIPYP
jgi:hypothetical protein